jgi:hypothetical protein
MLIAPLNTTDNKLEKEIEKASPNPRKLDPISEK